MRAREGRFGCNQATAGKPYSLDGLGSDHAGGAGGGLGHERALHHDGHLCKVVRDRGANPFYGDSLSLVWANRRR